VFPHFAPQKKSDIWKKKVLQVLGGDGIKVDLIAASFFPDPKPCPIPPNLVKGVYTRSGRATYNKAITLSSIDGERKQSK